MAYVDFGMEQHRATPRNYRERVTEHDKAACAEMAIKFGSEYWDGDRRCGYLHPLPSPLMDSGIFDKVEEIVVFPDGH